MSRYSRPRKNRKREEKTSKIRKYSKPVSIGQEIEVEIVEVSKRGDGVARVRGLVIFVPRKKPGDKVKVRITRVGRNYAVAEVIE